MNELITSGTEIANPYREFTFSVAVSGAETIFFAHRYFRVMTISGTASIRFGASGSKTSFIGAGVGIELDSPTDRVTIFNEGGGILTLTVALSMGRISDDRLNVSGTVSTQETKAATLTSTADVALAAASTIIKAANTTRRAIIITNTHAANAVRIGEVSVAAARGAYLAPGASISLDTTAAVYGYDASAAVTVSVLEVLD
jgi:hypothetical protein